MVNDPPERKEDFIWQNRVQNTLEIQTQCQVEYANKYMNNFVSHQTLINKIMSYNPVPENLKKGKILDPYVSELLTKQDEYICLNQDKILSNLKHRIAFTYGPLTKICTVTLTKKES